MIERAQLGGGAEVQARAFVEVEGLVEIVGLRAQQVAVFATLEQREAEQDLARVVALVQQPEAIEPGGVRRLRITQAAQQCGGGALQFAVERGVRRQVEPIELVGVRYREQRLQLAAHRIGRLAIDEGTGPRDGELGLQLQVQRQRGVAQARRDDAGLGHQAQVAVGQLAQHRLAFGQVVRGSALRDDQRERLLEGERAGSSPAPARCRPRRAESSRFTSAKSRP